MECKFEVGDVVVTPNNKVYTVTTVTPIYLELDNDYTCKVSFNSSNYKELTLAVSQLDHLIFIVNSHLKLDDISSIEQTRYEGNFYLNIEYGNKTRSISVDDSSKMYSIHKDVLNIWCNYLNSKSQINQNFN